MEGCGWPHAVVARPVSRLALVRIAAALLLLVAALRMRVGVVAGTLLAVAGVARALLGLLLLLAQIRRSHSRKFQQVKIVGQ